MATYCLNKKQFLRKDSGQSALKSSGQSRSISNSSSFWWSTENFSERLREASFGGRFQSTSTPIKRTSTLTTISSSWNSALKNLWTKSSKMRWKSSGWLRKWSVTERECVSIKYFVRSLWGSSAGWSSKPVRSRVRKRTDRVKFSATRRTARWAFKVSCWSASLLKRSSWTLSWLEYCIRARKGVILEQRNIWRASLTRSELRPE